EAKRSRDPVCRAEGDSTRARRNFRTLCCARRSSYNPVHARIECDYNFSAKTSQRSTLRPRKMFNQRRCGAVAKNLCCKRRLSVTAVASSFSCPERQSNGSGCLRLRTAALESASREEP